MAGQRALGYTVSHRNVQAAVQKALKFLGLPRGAMTVTLLSPSAMRKAGAAIRGKRSRHIPDVLSFAEPGHFPHPETKHIFLGEILLNRELAREGEKLLRMLVHGMAHLLGYTHDGKHDILKMEKLEEEIFTKLHSAFPKIFT